MTTAARTGKLIQAKRRKGPALRTNLGTIWDEIPSETNSQANQEIREPRTSKTGSIVRAQIE